VDLQCLCSDDPFPVASRQNDSSPQLLYHCCFLSLATEHLVAHHGISFMALSACCYAPASDHSAALVKGRGGLSIILVRLADVLGRTPENWAGIFVSPASRWWLWRPGRWVGVVTRAQHAVGGGGAGRRGAGEAGLKRGAPPSTASMEQLHSAHRLGLELIGVRGVDVGAGGGANLDVEKKWHARHPIAGPPCREELDVEKKLDVDKKWLVTSSPAPLALGVAPPAAAAGLPPPSLPPPRLPRSRLAPLPCGGLPSSFLPSARAQGRRPAKVDAKSGWGRSRDAHICARRGLVWELLADGE